MTPARLRDGHAGPLDGSRGLRYFRGGLGNDNHAAFVAANGPLFDDTSCQSQERQRNDDEFGKVHVRLLCDEFDRLSIEVGNVRITASARNFGAGGGALLPAANLEMFDLLRELFILLGNGEHLFSAERVWKALRLLSNSLGHGVIMFGVIHAGELTNPSGALK